MPRLLLSLVFAVAVTLGTTAKSANAALIPFILDGIAGQGLLIGNLPVGVGGSGGLGGTGITFDTTTNLLSIDVLWGSTNGFTDLSGAATGLHIHGATPSPAPGSFSESVGMLIPLGPGAGFSPSASAGGFLGSILYTNSDASDLLLGKHYLNVHTALNSGGEIRGTMVAIPEPSTLILFATTAACLVGYGWRRKRKMTA